MRKKIQKVSRSFRCTRQLSQQINDLADHTDRHASNVIRDALKFYLENSEHHLMKIRGAK